MVRGMIAEELERTRELLGPAFAAGKYEEGARLFERITVTDDYVEFLTLPAYELID
jgi:malate synthase